MDCRRTENRWRNLDIYDFQIYRHLFDINTIVSASLRKQFDPLYKHFSSAATDKQSFTGNSAAATLHI